MKALPLILCLALAPSVPAQAQASDDMQDNPIMRLLDLILPDEAKSLRRLGSPDQYQTPEILPNGDILIRRKPKPLPPPKDGEIDL